MMNRPRQPKKSEKIEVRLSHEEKSALQSLARRQGRTISTIVRDLLADHLRDVLQAEQQPSIRERTAMILKPVATHPRKLAAALAASLGLGYWQTMRLIILPQAIKLVIPAIVNQFISIFKDTSLVSIIGMFDLLGIIKFNFTDSTWASPVTPITGLIFAGLVFWVFCFGMSRYSSFMVWL